MEERTTQEFRDQTQGPAILITQALEFSRPKSEQTKWLSLHVAQIQNLVLALSEPWANFSALNLSLPAESKNKTHDLKFIFSSVT